MKTNCPTCKEDVASHFFYDGQCIACAKEAGVSPDFNKNKLNKNKEKRERDNK